MIKSYLFINRPFDFCCDHPGSNPRVYMESLPNYFGLSGVSGSSHCQNIEWVESLMVFSVSDMVELGFQLPRVSMF